MPRNDKVLLDEKAVQILGLIAEGRSYHQIVDGIGCTYLDIFAAAASALRVCEEADRPSYSMEEVRAEHPRAYLPWSDAEDAQLKQLMAAGKSASEIAATLQRQTSAIRSRMARFEVATRNGEGSNV
ncbi:MAG: hypothetical protein J5I93_09445 [Pirellulaceae bacterium]|nr:hypothetical protein [Pirellulaceae bacterium]